MSGDIVGAMREVSLGREAMRPVWAAAWIDEIERLRARVSELEKERDNVLSPGIGVLRHRILMTCTALTLASRALAVARGWYSVQQALETIFGRVR
jgi:hypothetical protein